MVPRKYIPSPLKESIVHAARTGARVCDIARTFGKSRSTVTNILKRYDARGTVRRMNKPGRPRKTTQKDDRFIKLESTRNPRLTVPQLQAHLSKFCKLDLSESTVNRRLHEAGLYGRHAAKKPQVSEKNRKARLAFARKYVNWTADDWQKVLFSDESKFELFRTKGVTYVRRPIGTRNDVRYQVPTVKHGGGNVMVWGCFSASGTGPLFRIEETMTAVLYCDIIVDTMLPYARINMPRGWLFQQDNDPKHTAGVVTQCFKRNKVRVLPWPSQSPDLNPIEHLWDELERRAGAHKCSNLGELFDRLQREWTEIDQNTIDRLLESMPRRCLAVINANGFPTKY